MPDELQTLSFKNLNSATERREKGKTEKRRSGGFSVRFVCSVESGSRLSTDVLTKQDGRANNVEVWSWPAEKGAAWAVRSSRSAELGGM